LKGAAIELPIDVGEPFILETPLQVCNAREPAGSGQLIGAL